jgi:Family of unknown function (DUF6535)
MHRVDISEPKFSESEIPGWKKIFNGQVQKGDPMWTQYLEEAIKFDARMVDAWNKIVDVILVYVGIQVLFYLYLQLLIMESRIGHSIHCHLDPFYHRKL